MRLNITYEAEHMILHAHVGIQGNRSRCFSLLTFREIASSDSGRDSLKRSSDMPRCSRRSFDASSSLNISRSHGNRPTRQKGGTA